MTRSHAAIPSIAEVEQSLAQFAALYRQVHAFAYDAGQSGGGGGSDGDPTGQAMLNGIDDHDGRQGARSSLVMMGRHIDSAITAGLGAIRIVQRSGNTAHSQSWTVEAAENVSSEYDQRKRRAHARSVGT